MPAARPVIGHKPSASDRVALNQDRIVEAALGLLDSGAPDITFRALGRALGADPTAVYRHFRNKDDLVLAVADHLLARASDGFTPSADWRDTVLTLCRSIRRVYLTHPRAAALVSARTARREHEFRVVEGFLTALSRAGFDRRSVALYYRVLVEATLALSCTEALVGSLADDVRTGDEQAWRREYAALSPERFPKIAEHSAELADISTEDIFETTMAFLLRSIEAQLPTT